MHIKNYDHRPPQFTTHAGLKVEGKYWFPSAFKYIAWCITFTVVVSSCTILVYYGISYGMIRTYLWLTVTSFSFTMGIFVVAPIRIFLTSLFDSFISKKASALMSRKIDPSLLLNPCIPEKKCQVLKTRQLNARLYSPIPLSKLKDRMEDIKYNIRLRNLTLEIVIHILFHLIVAHSIFLYLPEMPYYGTEAVKNLVVRGSYTKTIPFTSVNTYETFLEYMNETFLPALLLKSKYVENEFENDEKPNFKKGWTLNPSLKLLGKPRLRQVRVKTDSCKQIKALKGRNKECAAELTLFNVDTKSYTLRWLPGPPKGLTDSQKAPWVYRSSWESQSLPILGEFALYPGGGYVLDLARHIDDAMIVIGFMDEFQWVDVRTRGIFIEFTLYCVNSNFFIVVTLIAEKSATGYIIPNYQIGAYKILFNEEEHALEITQIIFLFLFSGFFFFVREGLKIHRTSFISYLKRDFAFVDSIFLILAFLDFIFCIVRSQYAAMTLKEIEKSDNNKFISFIYLAFWSNFSQGIEAFLFSFSIFKLFQFLMFKIALFRFHSILAHCYTHLRNLFLRFQIIIIAFAFFFYLALANYSYEFRNLRVSFLTVITKAASFGSDNNAFYNTSMHLGEIFLLLFVGVAIFLYANVFKAVICFYFRVIYDVPQVNKYDLLDYIKYVFTVTRQNDIFLRKIKNPPCDEKDSSVMRLRGGGKKSSAKCECKRQKKKEQKGKCVMRKTTMKEFVVKKPHDETEYLNLIAEREVAMKHLLLSLLAKGEKMAKCERNIALMALFCSLTSNKLKSYIETKGPGPYFLGKTKRKTKLFDKRRFYCMIKVIERTAKEEGWLQDEECKFLCLKCPKEKVLMLSEKLTLLMKLLRCRLKDK